MTDVKYLANRFSMALFVCFLLIFLTGRLVDSSAIWMKLDVAAAIDLQGRRGSSSAAAVRRSLPAVTPLPSPHRQLNSVRPWPWNTHLDDEYVNYSDGSTIDDESSSSRQITATRTAIYIGIVSFSAVIVVLCLVASSMAIGCKCCPRLARFCGCDEPTVAMTTAAVETGSDSAASIPSSVVIDAPPSYDEVIGRLEGVRIGTMTTTVAIDDLNYATGDDVPLASVSRGMSVGGFRSNACMNPVSRVLGGSRSSTSASSVAVSPPSYLQVIREWATKGILVNKALIIPTPPPSYSSLASTKHTVGKSGDVRVSPSTDGDSSSSLPRLTLGGGTSVSSPEGNVISPNETSDVGCSPETGDVSESRAGVSTNDVSVSPDV